MKALPLLAGTPLGSSFLWLATTATQGCRKLAWLLLFPAHSLKCTKNPISSSRQKEKESMFKVEFFYSLKRTLTLHRMNPNFIIHHCTMASICETVGSWTALHHSKTERLQKIFNHNSKKNGTPISERCMEMFPYCKTAFRKKAAI